MSTLLPPALLLAWSGIAATAMTAFVVAPLLGQPAAALALDPRSPSTTRALLLGIVVYPVLYALGFAALGEATLATGALLGIVHALLLALLSLRSGGRARLHANLPRLGVCLFYGLAIGFTFLMP